MEVGFKLAQTLWRKVLPAELEEADKHLHAVTYEALQREEWGWAKTTGEFAVGQKVMTSEQNRLIAIINLAIAMVASGDRNGSEILLATRDWSATAGEFQLAVAVLRGRYDTAAEIMERMGKRGELLSEAAYHDWPLFREFRDAPQFLKTYEKIYGHSFTEELTRKAADAGAKVLDAALVPSKEDPSGESPSRGPTDAGAEILDAAPEVPAKEDTIRPVE